MRVIVFGASGRTGSELVRQALERGHHVTAFIRGRVEQHGVWHVRLRVMPGNVLDAASVAAAIPVGTEADAVVFLALGARRGEPKGHSLLREGTANVLAAMRAAGVSRIVSMSAASFRDARDPPPLLRQRLLLALMTALTPDEVADAAGQLQLLRGSGTRWTIVRVPALADGLPTGSYECGYFALANEHVRRADVAACMIACAENNLYIGESPHIRSARPPKGSGAGSRSGSHGSNLTNGRGAGGIGGSTHDSGGNGSKSARRSSPTKAQTGASATLAAPAASAVPAAALFEA